MNSSDTPVETLAHRAGSAFAGYQGGDRQRLSELVDLVTPLLWHTVRAQRVGDHQAEDIVQTTWLRLVHHADAIQDPRAVLAWLIVTAKRELAGRQGRPPRAAAARGRRGRQFPTGRSTAPRAQRSRPPRMRPLAAHRDPLGTLPQPPPGRRLLRPTRLRLGRPSPRDARGSIGPTRGRCLAKLRLLLDADPHWGIS